MKKKNTSSDNIITEVKNTKALHAVLICLMIFAIFSSTAVTAATLRPLIQQDNNLILKEKTALHNSVKVSQKGKPGLTILGDPIEDPKPH